MAAASTGPLSPSSDGVRRGGIAPASATPPGAWAPSLISQARCARTCSRSSYPATRRRAAARPSLREQNGVVGVELGGVGNKASPGQIERPTRLHIPIPHHDQVPIGLPQP